MGRVLADERRRLDGGMPDELRAEQIQVPGPAMPGVGGGVDAEKAAPAAHVGLQRVLPRRVQDLPGGVQEDDRRHTSQQVGPELRRVLGGYRRCSRPAMSRTTASAAEMESCRKPSVRV